MLKNFLSFVILLFLVVAFPANTTFAKDVTIVNPIRGNDFWSYNYSILETPEKQYELISQKKLQATWLVRYDGLKDEKVIQFLKKLNSDQEIGIFFEVTPSLTSDAGVKYNQSENWHFARSVLLTGYSFEDRKKLIDTTLGRYKDLFGKNPKSVGAWWIDANSLGYLKDKYQIEASLDVADQFSTDGYQVWGQYWSTPFYPAKANALMPAQSADQKVGVVTIQWAHRDPFNGYGNGVFESTYSVQANDYILHNLKTDYFSKLIDIYPQITIGLENDFEWNKFGGEYTNQLNEISQKLSQGEIEVLTMENFSKKYQQENPEVSPEVLIQADDPLGTEGKVVWYQTPKYRIGWFYGPYGSVIRDLRELNDSNREECFDKACESLKLAFSSISSIDEVNFGTRWLIDEGKITNVSIVDTIEGARITYKNQTGFTREINFLKNDIKIDDDIKPISSFILRAVENSQNNSQIKNQDEADFISIIDWQKFIPQFLLSVAKFLVLTFLFFFIPGWVLTRRFLYSIPVGWVIFTLISYLLGFLNLDNLIWIIPVVSLLGFFKTGFPRLKFKINKEFLLTGVVVSLGSLSWLLTQIKNGIPTNFGYGYWGPNGHDGIWHLSLISELSKNIPPQNPLFAGVHLTNYHYFFDLLLARSSVLFGIDSQDLLFRLFPVMISVLTGYLFYFTLKKILIDRDLSVGFSQKAALLSVFFLYFGGSFGWIVAFLRNRDFGGETMFWAQQSISTLLNPPFAISITLFITGLYFYHLFKTEKKLNIKNLIITAVVWGSLIEFKAYAGVLVLGALGVVTIERLFHKEIKFLILFILTLFISMVVFLPSNYGSGGLLEFKPLWLIDTMIAFEDRLFLPRLYLTMQSGVLYKVIPAFSLALVIFVIGNFGTRILALLSPKTLIDHRFLAIFTLGGVVLPLLFIQKGNNWNIVQFMYYSLMVAGFFAAVTIIKMSQKMGKVLGTVFIALIILITVPTSYSTTGHYTPKRPPAKISTDEIKALEFLKHQPQGVVLSMPYDQKLAKQYEAPKPLAFYTSTAYVSAFSNHPGFMEDSVNLEILGIDFKGRTNVIREFTKATQQSKKILQDNNIKYVYILKSQNIPVDEGRMGIKKIYENSEAQIFKVE